VLKLRGIYQEEQQEITLTDSGELTGHIPLVLDIMDLSAQYEVAGVIPGPNYRPMTQKFYKDETALILMMKTICDLVQYSRKVADMPETDGE
jgi:hypothetical protein